MRALQRGPARIPALPAVISQSPFSYEWKGSLALKRKRVRMKEVRYGGEKVKEREAHKAASAGTAEGGQLGNGGTLFQDFSS